MENKMENKKILEASYDSKKKFNQYVFKNGHVVIDSKSQHNQNKSPNDELNLQNIDKNDVEIKSDKFNLIIKLLDNSGSITILDHFNPSNSHSIEKLIFSDGVIETNQMHIPIIETKDIGTILYPNIGAASQPKHITYEYNLGNVIINTKDFSKSADSGYKLYIESGKLLCMKKLDTTLKVFVSNEDKSKINEITVIDQFISKPKASDSSNKLHSIFDENGQNYKVTQTSFKDIVIESDVVCIKGVCSLLAADIEL